MRWIAGVTIAAVASSFAEAIAADCSEPAVVARYLQARCENDAAFDAPQRVLTFNHETRRWQSEYLVRIVVDRVVPRRECRVTIVEKAVPRERRDGTAWTYRGRRERVLALVTRTNPMLYSAVSKGGEPRDISELAGLEKVAGLVGGALTGGVPAPAVVPEAVAAAPPATPEDLLTTLEAFGKITRLPRPPAPPPPPPDWAKLADELTERAKARILAGETPLSTVQKALGTLNGALQTLSAEHDRVVSYLQTLEDGRGPEWLNPPVPQLTAPDIDDRFVALQSALAALASIRFDCVGPYAGVRESAAAWLAKDPGPGALTQAMVTAKELQALDGSSGCVRDEIDTFRRIGKALEAPAMSDPLTRPGLDRLYAAATVYTGAAEGRRVLEEQAAKLLKERPTADATAASLDALRRRESDRAVRIVVEGCPGAGILEVPTRKDIYAWDTVQPFSFELSLDVPESDKVSARRIDPGAASYELEPQAWFRPLVSFGLTRASSLREPTFGLVKIGEKEYVERVGEKRRVAVPTAFVSFRPFPGYRRRTAGPLLDPAIDFGVGLDVSDPAFFVGGSVRVFFGARLGLGATWQRITALDGQQEVTVLPDGSIDPSLVPGAAVRAVRTRSLPFFGQ
jgi:hypothetical protein